MCLCIKSGIIRFFLLINTSAGTNGGHKTCGGGKSIGRASAAAMNSKEFSPPASVSAGQAHTLMENKKKHLSIQVSSVKSVRYHQAASSTGFQTCGHEKKSCTGCTLETGWKKGVSEHRRRSTEC